MTWFKVDDHLHSHRKAIRAGTEAMGLWVLAGSWSGAEENDGWVPAYVLTRLAGPRGSKLADKLVAAGLWHADTVDGEDGYRFHTWEEYQPTKQTLESKREANRERMRGVRTQGGKVRANKGDSADRVHAHTGDSAEGVRSTPARPDPSIKNTAADAAEFEAFWTAYPRKVGRDAAATKWAKVTKATDADTIMAGLANAQQVWTTTGTEPRFIPHPATWLNQGRWADEVPLPDMPTGPRLTAAQCDGTDCPGTPHEWTDRHGRNRFACAGA